MSSADNQDTLTSVLRALNAIARGDRLELAPYIRDVDTFVSVPGTDSICHCHVITLDGNGRCRIKDLVRFLQFSLIEYAIPRSRAIAAIEYFERTGSIVQIGRIQQQAMQLFADVEKSGEGGELLLFLLAERMLQLPQLLCKMDLKTSSNVHFHGSDGLHVGPGSDGKLALYWGESKLYANFSDGLSACMDSLKPLLTEATALDSRDLQLLGRYMDLADPDLENALKAFLNPDSALFSAVEYRGLCLIGFNSHHYPAEPNETTLDELVREAAQSLAQWISSVSRKVKALEIHTYHIHVFCIPFPSVDEFRKEFRSAFGGKANVDP